MDNVKSIIPAEPNFSLEITGFHDKERICREYAVIAWGFTEGEGGGRFSNENRYVLPIVIADKPFPVNLEELAEILKREGIKNVSYCYLRNGVFAHKNNVVKEPLKRLH